MEAKEDETEEQDSTNMVGEDLINEVVAPEASVNKESGVGRIRFVGSAHGSGRVIAEECSVSSGEVCSDSRGGVTNETGESKSKESPEKQKDLSEQTEATGEESGKEGQGGVPKNTSGTSVTSSLGHQTPTTSRATLEVRPSRSQEKVTDPEIMTDLIGKAAEAAGVSVQQDNVSGTWALVSLDGGLTGVDSSVQALYDDYVGLGLQAVQPTPAPRKDINSWLSAKSSEAEDVPLERFKTIAFMMAHSYKSMRPPPGRKDLVRMISEKVAPEFVGLVECVADVFAIFAGCHSTALELSHLSAQLPSPMSGIIPLPELLEHMRLMFTDI